MSRKKGTRSLAVAAHVGEVGKAGRPMIDPCQSLWVAVITTAIADGRRCKDGHTRDTARKFLANSPALKLILELLGINPDWWRWRMLPELVEQWEAAGTGDLTVVPSLSSVRSAAASQSWVKLEYEGAADQKRQGGQNTDRSVQRQILVVADATADVGYAGLQEHDG